MVSISENIDMECPGCKAKQDVTAWKLLDIGTDPELKEALFKWQINVFACNSCDFRAQLPIGLRYIDPGRQFSVQYYPVDALGSEEFYSAFDKCGNLLDDDCDEPGDAPIKPHFVFDMGEMMRYIAFREIAYEKGK